MGLRAAAMLALLLSSTATVETAPSPPAPYSPNPTGPADGIGPQDEPLRVGVRPPRQTAAQASAMAQVYKTAAEKSAVAKPWALSYMGSSAVRSRLHPSLQHYTNAQLLEMFTWEFERLQIFHNAPLDSFGEKYAHVADDTPLNISLENGYLQTTCQRYVLSGPESWLAAGLSYSSMFEEEFGVDPGTHWDDGTQCAFLDSLRSANDCLLFNANNLLKNSVANMLDYGTVTYLLNPKVMRNSHAFHVPHNLYRMRYRMSPLLMV